VFHDNVLEANTFTKISINGKIVQRAILYTQHVY